MYQVSHSHANSQSLYVFYFSFVVMFFFTSSLLFAPQVRDRTGLAIGRIGLSAWLDLVACENFFIPSL
jgi:hypothetical protein